MKLTKITDPAKLAELNAKEGPQGPQGPMGEQGMPGKPGPQGPKGDVGSDGVGVSKAWLDKDLCLMLEYTNGVQVNVGCLKDQTLEQAQVKGNNVFGGGGGGFVITGLYYNDNGELILKQLGKPDINAGSPGGTNLYIQDSQPTDAGSYLWIETNINSDGDYSFWFCQ